MQALRYLTLAAVAKWTCEHVRLARCSREESGDKAEEYSALFLNILKIELIGVRPLC